MPFIESSGEVINAARPLLNLRSFLHTAHTLRAEGSSMNPLQQAPSPLMKDEINRLGDATDDTMVAVAVLRGLPISPKKLNDFAGVVRRQSLHDAFIQCAISVKKSAKLVEKGLKSAKANAINNHGMNPERLALEEITVGQGRHLKRLKYHAKGRVGKKVKYRSHLTIKLSEKDAKPRTEVRPMLMEGRKFWKLRERAGIL